MTEAVLLDELAGTPLDPHRDAAAQGVVDLSLRARGRCAASTSDELRRSLVFGAPGSCKEGCHRGVTTASEARVNHRI
jgi:hypothetical protein